MSVFVSYNQPPDHDRAPANTPLNRPRKSMALSLALAGVTLGLSVGLNALCAWGAELNGFSIDTRDKAVTITLFTDQKVSYVTEHQGRQTVVVLSGVHLSREQMDNGLPVVIDNRNRFIGRAVPADDDKIKIILPNLPADEYTVSVIQKHAGSEADAMPASSTPIRSHSAIGQNEPDPLERIASHFSTSQAKARPAERPVQRSTRKPPPPSPTPRHDAPPRETDGHTSVLWNPYVASRETVFRKTDIRSVRLPEASPHEHPVSSRHATGGPVNANPVNALSLADLPVDHGLKMALSGQSASRATALPGRLDSLRALAPGTDAGTGAHNPPLVTATASPQIQSPQETQAVRAQASTASTTQAQPVASPPAAGGGLPPWLWIPLVIFLCGVGLFGLLGAAILIRFLWLRRGGAAASEDSRPPAPQPTEGGPPVIAPSPVSSNGSGSAEIPRDAFLNPVFQDKAAIRSQDYLKTMPENIAQAVRNAVPQTFISRKKSRFSAMRPPYRQTD